MEIQQKAKEILEKNSINVLKNEKEIIDKLERLSNSESKSLTDEKELEEIERYLEDKKKKMIENDDMEFLKNLADNLRKQSVRFTDFKNPPMFKIKNSIQEDTYFLTREALNKFIEYNEDIKNQIIEIPESNSLELAHLLEIIKRNF